MNEPIFDAVLERIESLVVEDSYWQFQNDRYKVFIKLMRTEDLRPFPRGIDFGDHVRLSMNVNPDGDYELTKSVVEDLATTLEFSYGKDRRYICIPYKGLSSAEEAREWQEANLPIGTHVVFEFSRC